MRRSSLQGFSKQQAHALTLAGSRRRYDCGIQTFDTAPVYSNGLSEVILGKAIKQFNLPREELVIMTKVCDVLRTSVTQRGPRTDST